MSKGRPPDVAYGYKWHSSGRPGRAKLGRANFVASVDLNPWLGAAGMSWRDFKSLLNAAAATALVLLAAAVVASVCAVAAQEVKVKKIGVILQGGPWYAVIEGLRGGLNQSGLVEGKGLWVQSVSATPLVVYRLAFRSPGSFADVD